MLKTWLRNFFLLVAVLDRRGNHEAVVNLSVLIEAAIESSFQFWLQTIFLIPTVIITVTDGLVNWKDLFSWRLASICISLGTFSFACYSTK